MHSGGNKLKIIYKDICEKKEQKAVGCDEYVHIAKLKKENHYTVKYCIKIRATYESVVKKVV